MALISGNNNTVGPRQLIRGTVTDDIVYANDGNSTIYTYAGNGVIVGGSGSNWLYGGIGDDTYVLGSSNIGQAPKVDFIFEKAGEGFDTVIVTDARDAANLRFSFTKGGSGPGDVTLDIRTNDKGDTVQIAKFVTGAQNPADGVLSNAVDSFVFVPVSGAENYTLSSADLFSLYQQSITLGFFGKSINFIEASANKAVWYSAIASVTEPQANTRTTFSNLSQNQQVTDSNPPANTLKSLLGAGNTDDLTLGLNGDDIIRSGAGDDILDGGFGNDLLFGGSGNDTYIFGLNSNNFANYVAGQDVVLDISGNDVVQVTKAAAYTDFSLAFVNYVPGGTEADSVLFKTSNLGDTAVLTNQLINADVIEFVRFTPGTFGTPAYTLSEAQINNIFDAFTAIDATGTSFDTLAEVSANATYTAIIQANLTLV